MFRQMAELRDNVERPVETVLPMVGGEGTDVTTPLVNAVCALADLQPGAAGGDI